MTSTSESNRFTCPSCGAQQTFEPGARSLKCDYCGRLTQLVSDVEQIPAECDFVVPMVATLGGLELAAYEYMTQGRYTKDDIVEHARIVSVERHYAPFYRYRGQYEGNWSASFGYKRQEPYTDWENDTQGNRRPVTRYRTVTDWRPASGNFSGFFTLIGYGGNSLSSSVGELIETSPGIDAATSDPGNYIAGFSVEVFTRTADDVFSGMPSARLDEIISNNVRSNSQGDASRDWHWRASRSYEWDTILMPIGHVTFEYGEDRFNVWVDGADLSRVHGDALPQDQSTKNAVAVSFVPFVVGLVATALFFMTPTSAAQSASRLGLYSAIISAAALAYGYLRRQSLLAYSASVRAAVLNFQRASRSNDQAMGESMQFAKPVRNLLSMEGPKPVWLASAIVLLANLAVYVAGVEGLSVTPDQATRQQATEVRRSTAASQQQEASRPPSPISIAPQPSQRAPQSTLPVASAGGSSAERTDRQAASTSDLENYQTSIICSNALDRTKLAWDTGNLFAPYASEARRRGLAVQDCRNVLGLGNAVEQQQSGGSELAALSTARVCYEALDSQRTGWDSRYRTNIREAQRRGLSIDDCRQALGLSRVLGQTTPNIPPAVVTQSTSPTQSERDKGATTATFSSSRASITSQSGAVVSFDSNVLSIDPQGNDVFNPRQSSYNISWTAPSYGNDVIVFIQISPNTRCIGAREYFQTVLQPRRRRVQELTEVADTSRTFVGIAAHGQGTRSGQDPFRNNEFTDLIFVSSGNRSTIVHIGARFPTQAASAIRREISQIVSSMTFPHTDLYGGC